MTLNRVKTDERGCFQIRVDPDAIAGFSVQLDRVVVAEFAPRPISSGGRFLEQDLEIDAFATVEGIVRANSLLPVVGVNLSGPAERIYHAPIDEQGHYRIARLEPGPYVVRVGHSDAASRGGVRFESSRVDLVAHPGESLSHDIDLRGDLLFVADQGGGGCDGPAFRERVLRRAGDEYRAEDLTIPVGRVEELRRAILEARSVPCDHGEQRPLDPSILLQTAGIPVAEWEAALRAREVPSLPGGIRPYTRTVVLPGDPEIRILATFWLSRDSKLDPGLGPVPLFLLWIGEEARQSLDPALGSALQAFFPRGGTVSSFAGATLR